MYNTLTELIKAKYYKDRAEAMSIVNTMFAGKAITAEEYTQLVILIDQNYPELVVEPEPPTEEKSEQVEQTT